MIFVPKQKLYSSEYFTSGEHIAITQDRQGSLVVDPSFPITFVPKRKFSEKKAALTIRHSINKLGRGF